MTCIAYTPALYKFNLICYSKVFKDIFHMKNVSGYGCYELGSNLQKTDEGHNLP